MDVNGGWNRRRAPSRANVLTFLHNPRSSEEYLDKDNLRTCMLPAQGARGFLLQKIIYV